MKILKNWKKKSKIKYKLNLYLKLNNKTEQKLN